MRLFPLTDCCPPSLTTLTGALGRRLLLQPPADAHFSPASENDAWRFLQPLPEAFLPSPSLVTEGDLFLLNLPDQNRPRLGHVNVLVVLPPSAAVEAASFLSFFDENESRLRLDCRSGRVLLFDDDGVDCMTRP